MGMVAVTVSHNFAGQFLDLCEEAIVDVAQDDLLQVCRFTLDVPEMVSCEADVLCVTADDGTITDWLVPRMPTHPDPVLTAKLDELLRECEAT